MTRFLLAGAAAFGMMTGAAMAQMSGSTTTTTTTTTPYAPTPLVVASGATVGHAVLADGDRTSTSGTSVTDSSGKTVETSITNQTYPLTSLITSTKKTTTIDHGMATEITTTTSTWPGTPTPPMVTTTTRTWEVSAK